MKEEKENEEIYKKIVDKETERKREFVYVSENVVFKLFKKKHWAEIFSNNLSWSHITIFCCAKTESNSWKFFLL